jgi:DNA-binding transcriptional LysR family regulator
MDIPKLRIFVTVVQLGSFTRAAEVLYLTQPTVSQQIAALEAQLGMQLIERLPRQLRLTPAGAALLPYAEQILELTDTAINATRAAAGLADRTLRIGVGHTLATYLLPKLLQDFRERNPHHIARISVGNTATLLDMLASDTVELALVGSPANHPKIEIVPFMHDHLRVIVAPSDPWAKRSSIDLSELAGRVLLTREPGSALYATIEQLLGTATLASDQVIVLGETEAIKRSVEAGLGVALIQGIAIEREVASGTLCALPLRGGDDSRTYNYAWRSGRELSTIAQELVELLHELGN